MEIRIYVTYPATDGSMPENVEVEIKDAKIGEVQPLLASAMAALLAVPSTRYTATVAGPEPAEQDFDASGSPKCRRTLCGHPQSVHRIEQREKPVSGIIAAMSAAGPMDHPQERYGACAMCSNTAQCEYFVGDGDGWRDI